VDRALKAVSREVNSATKRVNQQAGKLMARGDYEGAQVLIELGKSVRDFQAQVDELRARWKTLRAGASGGTTGRAETTPVWKLYGPILRTLLANGGMMSWKAIQESLGSGGDFAPLAGDHLPQRGKPRWVHAAYRARGGLVKEGFIEKRGHSEWRITAAGRKAAESGLAPR
jgi:hypothetical protein